MEDDLNIISVEGPGATGPQGGTGPQEGTGGQAGQGPQGGIDGQGGLEGLQVTGPQADQGLDSQEVTGTTDSLQSINAPIPDSALDYQLCRYIDADTTGPDFKIKVSSKLSNKTVTFELGDSTHKNIMRILAGWGIHRSVNEISDQIDFLKLKMSPGATYDPNITFHSSLGFGTYQGKPIFKYFGTAYWFKWVLPKHTLSYRFSVNIMHPIFGGTIQ